jgi:ribosomal protein S27AE
MTKAKRISGDALRVFIYELIIRGMGKAEACMEIRKASGCSLKESVNHYDRMAAVAQGVRPFTCGGCGLTTVCEPAAMEEHAEKCVKKSTRTQETGSWDCPNRCGTTLPIADHKTISAHAEACNWVCGLCKAVLAKSKGEEITAHFLGHYQIEEIHA